MTATLVDTGGTTNALTSFEGLSDFMSATSADNGLDDGSNLNGWTGWCYAFPLFGESFVNVSWLN